MSLIVVFLSSLFMVSSVFAASVPAMTLSSLTSAMNERMTEMKDVAIYKVVNHLPVEDLEREKNVLLLAQNEAEEAGLDPKSVLPFIQAQMDVAKAIQYRYFADWLSQPDSGEKPKSLNEVRASISAQDKDILNAISQRLLAGRFSEEDKSEIMTLLHAPQLTEADKARLVQALSVIRRVK